MSQHPVDVPAIRTVLAETLSPDPMLRWIFIDEEHRVDAAAAWLGLFAEAYARSGRIDTIELDQLNAVALWRMPADQQAAAHTRPTIAALLDLVTGRAR